MSPGAQRCRARENKIVAGAGPEGSAATSTGLDPTATRLEGASSRPLQHYEGAGRPSRGQETVLRKRTKGWSVVAVDECGQQPHLAVGPKHLQKATNEASPVAVA